jgi:hypothetical protein
MWDGHIRHVGVPQEGKGLGAVEGEEGLDGETRGEIRGRRLLRMTACAVFCARRTEEAEKRQRGREAERQRGREIPHFADSARSDGFLFCGDPSASRLQILRTWVSAVLRPYGARFGKRAVQKRKPRRPRKPESHSSRTQSGTFREKPNGKRKGNPKAQAEA